MANIIVTVATNVAKYLEGPATREIQYLFCVNNIINDLEHEKEVLTSERDILLTRVAQAMERTEVIEKPVEKWLSDVENLLREVDNLLRRTETDNNCFQGWFPTWGRYLMCRQMVEKIEAVGKFQGKSNDIQPFSHRAPLPCIQYESSEDFTYFDSRNVAYSHEMIVDIIIRSGLERFVLDDRMLQERRGVLRVKDFDISTLKTSRKNILQITEIISLEDLHGGCKNIIPDMVGAVGGMNDLTYLHLTRCKEIECIFDATYDFKEDDLIPRLVELYLESMDNLTEFCRGPPLQVLRYFEKLELLDINHCWKMRIIFPWKCNLGNLKILNLSFCKTDEVLLSASVAQSMQQLEKLTICGCYELKHIIAVSEKISPAPMNSHFFMTKLRSIDIFDCQSLESIFPICYVEGLIQLQEMEISHSYEMEYVFGKCDHEEHLSSNHVMPPRLEVLRLSFLKNLTGICPENYQAKEPSQSLRKLIINDCPKLVIPWFRLKVGNDQRQHHPNQIWSFQCLQSIRLDSCENLKYLFSMDIMNKMEIVLPNLTEISLKNLPNFVDICYGCKLHAAKLLQLHISYCPKTAPSLRQILVDLEETA